MTGEQGETGSQGLQGEQGLQGLQGLKGDAGSTPSVSATVDTSVEGQTTVTISIEGQDDVVFTILDGADGADAVADADVVPSYDGFSLVIETASSYTFSYDANASYGLTVYKNFDGVVVKEFAVDNSGSWVGDYDTIEAAIAGILNDIATLTSFDGLEEVSLQGQTWLITGKQIDGADVLVRQIGTAYIFEVGTQRTDNPETGGVKNYETIPAADKPDFVGGIYPTLEAALALVNGLD